MNKKKVISAGHICLDITPTFKSREEKKVRDLFIPGQLIAMDQANVSLGGSVSNTGIGMKILGADVELMGMIGNDAFGRIILKELEQYGVALDSMIITEDTGTSYSVILAPAGIDRMFLHYTGANDRFTLDSMDLDKVKKADLFHFGYPPLMRMMYKDDGRELIRLLKSIHDQGTAVSVDMAMVEEETEAGTQDWEAILKAVIPYIDFFVPSAEELCMMLDRERYHQWKTRAGENDIMTVLDIERDIRPLADKLLSYGARVILIKCGAPGLYFRTASKKKLLTVGGGIGSEIADEWADKECFEKSYYVDRVVSGTGAGDTTIAAFLTAVLEGKGWQNALHLAAAAGALCVQNYDALSGMIPLAKIQEKIDAGWAKRK